MNSGLIPGGQNLSKRQTVFFMLVDLMNKEHKDPDTVDLEAPRLARYLQTPWKKHQNTVYVGRYQTCSKERIKVLSDAIQRHHPLQHTPSLVYPDGNQDGNWRNHLRESICVTPASSEDFLFEHDWMKELGSENPAQAESSQPTQPKTPNPMHRTGRPVTTEQTSRWSAQEIDTRFLHRCESTNLSVERSDKYKDTDENVDADRVRTGPPVGSEQSFGVFTQRDEIDTDFRVSGLPHAVVKQAENSRVREWSRRSRATLIDKRFKPICNKVMPTTHLVKNQRR